MVETLENLLLITFSMVLTSSNVIRVKMCLVVFRTYGLNSTPVMSRLNLMQYTLKTFSLNRNIVKRILIKIFKMLNIFWKKNIRDVTSSLYKTLVILFEWFYKLPVPTSLEIEIFNWNYLLWENWNYVLLNTLWCEEIILLNICLYRLHVGFWLPFGWQSYSMLALKRKA